jgi:error-prone DNA polymerase
MIGVRGRIQREGEVVHLVAHELTDLSAELASVGNHETPFPLPHGRGDEAQHGGSGSDRRGAPKARNIVDPYEHIDQIKVKTRDFR